MPSHCSSVRVEHVPGKIDIRIEGNQIRHVRRHARILVAEQEHRDHIDRTDQELVHHDDARAVAGLFVGRFRAAGGQALGHAGVGHLGQHRDQEDHDAEVIDSAFTGGRFAAGPEQHHEGKAADGKDEADHVDQPDLLAEKEDAEAEGENRIEAENQGGDGRGVHQEKTVGLGEEVNQRLEQTNQQKQAEVPPGADLHRLPGQPVENEQDRSRHEDTERQEVLRRDAERLQPVCPDQGHTPKTHHQQGEEIDSHLLDIKFHFILRCNFNVKTGHLPYNIIFLVEPFRMKTVETACKIVKTEELMRSTPQAVKE